MHKGSEAAPEPITPWRQNLDERPILGPIRQAGLNRLRGERETKAPVPWPMIGWGQFKLGQVRRTPSPTVAKELVVALVTPVLVDHEAAEKSLAVSGYELQFSHLLQAFGPSRRRRR